MGTLPNGGTADGPRIACRFAISCSHRENGGPEDDQGCASVHAVGIGQDLGGGSTTATISHGGRLNGTTTGQFAISGAPPVFTITGTVVFTTKGGTLTATVSGTFNVLTGEFVASGPVSAGSGNLAGTTGILTFQGVENLATGVFTETITGTLCNAGDDGEDD